MLDEWTRIIRCSLPPVSAGAETLVYNIQTSSREACTVISIADRVGHIAGVTNRWDESWMLQIGRHLLDTQDAAFAGKKYLIVDRDTKYSKRFRDFIAEGGAEVIRLPPLSPNLNAFAERFVRSIEEGCLTKMIFIGQGSLCRAITEYMTHLHKERDHCIAA